jgi:S-adenosylmethionine-diacylglycerol 3-amino-3-carboxypropyl transferase
MAEIATLAKFDFIRYANCWEDADVLLTALRPTRNDACLSIASAGDNSFSLLSRSPSLVVAFDLNLSQIACVEIRKAAFIKLTHPELLQFLGIHHSDSRVDTYEKLRPLLSDSARSFWDAHADTIANGIIHAGKFENYFRIFRTRVLPLIHGKKDIESLLEEKSVEDRKHFYDNRWNNARWRFLFRIFFGRFAMGRLGRDPEFFTYVDADVAGNILRRTEYAFTELPTHSNPYLTYIMKGNFSNGVLPHYLREENFSLIKKNINKLVTVHGDMLTCRDMFRKKKCSCFNLSDIFEYMNMVEFRSYLSHISSMASSGARIAFWNMLVDRIIPSDAPFETDSDLSRQLHAIDRAFFYKRFIVARHVIRSRR